jgi:hypothetical protein
LFDLKGQKASVTTKLGGEKEVEGEELIPPSTVSDIRRVEFLMDCDRTMIDFKSEIKSLYLHEQDFQRPRLNMIVNQIYIPKLKAKSFAAYLYAGENHANHSNYKLQGEQPNKVFSDPSRSKEEYILGIESSFDESAASLVNSFGDVVANNQITQWEQWRDFDGVVPDVAA